MGAKKNFVLDTNVILHDYKCIENFQENDIYLPIVVLEELDKFKKGSEQINYNAREFVRELDLLTSNDLFLKGASLGPGKGTLYIVTGDKVMKLESLEDGTVLSPLPAGPVIQTRRPVTPKNSFRLLLLPHSYKAFRYK